RQRNSGSDRCRPNSARNHRRPNSAPQLPLHSPLPFLPRFAVGRPQSAQGAAQGAAAEAQSSGAKVEVPAASLNSLGQSSMYHWLASTRQGGARFVANKLQSDAAELDSLSVKPWRAWASWRGRRPLPWEGSRGMGAVEAAAAHGGRRRHRLGLRLRAGRVEPYRGDERSSVNSQYQHLYIQT
ncbi:unnamed protein product, partial [Urochloa humidicola]